MKKVTIFLMSILLVFAVNAQTTKHSSKTAPFAKVKKTRVASQSNTRTDIFSEGFEAGIPATWLNIDSDGDTYKWDTSTVFNPHSGNACAKSASWVNSTVGAVKPSNWLITPSITLPAGGNYVVEYWVSGQDQLYAAEHYKLLVSPTAASDTTSFTANVQEETLTVGDGTENNYLKRTINLTAYAGTSIRLAWVHFACTDQFYINLDDIRIYEPAATDAKVVSTTLPQATCGMTANTDVVVKVYNNGLNAITSLPIHYKKGINGTVVNETINTNIPSFSEYTYTFTAGADFSAVGKDSVLAWVTLPSDQDNNNDTSAWASTENIAPATIPYLIGFETTDNLAGWNIIDNNNDASTWSIYSDATIAHSGDGFAAYKYNAATAGDDWLVTKCVNLTPGNYAVTYNYRAYDAGYPESMSVAYGTSNTVTGLTNVIATHASITDTIYQLGIAPFTITTAGTYYFGFQANSAADEWYLILDDISVVINDGVSENNNQFFMNTYPNPAKDQLVVDASAKINAITVYNIVGKQVLNSIFNSQSVTLNTSNLQSGIYFVKVETASGIKTQKINIVR